MAAAQPVVLQREQTPQGLRTPTRVVTKQTVDRMCQHIRDAQSDPAVQAIAGRLSASAASPADQLTSIWMWVKHHVKFVHDDVLIRQLFNEGGHFELLISPPVLLRMPDPRGDCDDFTMLADALACAIGFRTVIITLACDRKRPGEYSHVYGGAYLPNGVLCPLDCSHGRHPGWEVPSRDVQRKTVWDMNGQVISDEPGPAAMPMSPASSTNAGMGSVPPGLPVLAGMPQYETGLPIIGTLDFQNPLEWLTLGGAAASALFAPSGGSKIAGVAGFLGARYLLSSMWGSW